MISSVNMIAWMPGPMEMFVIAIFGLLIFGKRLPEVGKSLGKSIVEFKKGLNGIEDQINEAANRPDMLPPPQRTTDTPAAQAQPNPQSTVPHD